MLSQPSFRYKYCAVLYFVPYVLYCKYATVYCTVNVSKMQQVLLYVNIKVQHMNIYCKCRSAGVYCTVYKCRYCIHRLVLTKVVLTKVLVVLEKASSSLDKGSLRTRY